MTAASHTDVATANLMVGFRKNPVVMELMFECIIETTQLAKTKLVKSKYDDGTEAVVVLFYAESGRAIQPLRDMVVDFINKHTRDDDLSIEVIR